MEITFKGSQYDLPANVHDRATTKLTAIKKYLGPKAGLARAYVELGKESGAHTSGDIWSASIRLTVDGKSFTSKEVADTIETALDRAIDEMGTEVRKARQRERSLFLKGRHAIKSLVRGFGS